MVWEGVEPINGSTGGYEINGKFVATAAGLRTEPAAAFNDVVLTIWLASNRSVRFDKNQGWAKSIWVGGVNIGAVFFITGDSSDVTFKALHLSVPKNAGGDHFLPMAISFSANWKRNSTVTGKSPHTAQFAAIPRKMTFSEVDFDGTLMGWQGNVRDATFDNVQSHRYGDLQDAQGANSGGVNKWFPPPHLFYLNYAGDGDPELFNSNIRISNVVDSGPRVGVARDKGHGDGMSGFASSLKLGCTHCTVDHYSSTRPDGFMDVLPSDGLTVSNVTASFDSVFLNNVFPAGIRFPGNGYRHVIFENVILKDTSDAPTAGPIGNAPYATNDGITFRHVTVVLNRWDGNPLPLPKIAGSGNDMKIDFSLPAQQREAAFRLRDDGRWDPASPP